MAQKVTVDNISKNGGVDSVQMTVLCGICYKHGV